MAEELGAELFFDQVDGLSVLLADCRMEKCEVILLVFGVKECDDALIFAFVWTTLLLGSEVFGKQSREFAVVFGFQRIKHGAARRFPSKPLKEFQH